MTEQQWAIPASERDYLRELARRQRALAALPVMEERRRQWYGVNDGQAGVRPPVVLEAGTFWGEFMPESVLHCASPLGRAVERQIVGLIRNHELIDDDKIVPDTFDIAWVIHVDPYGIPIATEKPTGENPGIGYQFIHPVHDLKEDLGKFRPMTCRVDRADTLSRKAFLEELFDGILPVEIRTWTSGQNMLTHHVVALMGMEAFFLAMYDCPTALHTLMARLRDNALGHMRWLEDERLLRLDNNHQYSCWSSANFTRQLPAPGFDPAHVRLRDVWGYCNSQESVGISAELFHEFVFPYYRDICAPLGRVYFGCCEPVHPFWEDLRHLPHLSKVSISKWCDERFMGEALRGTGIVFSRKPDPNLIGVDVRLDEAAWAKHIRTTLDATRGVPVEFIIRDVYTVHGDLDKCRRAVAIARQEAEAH
jgi:hypothetical protein